jgi:hypothetical protein
MHKFGHVAGSLDLRGDRVYAPHGVDVGCPRTLWGAKSASCLQIADFSGHVSSLCTPQAILKGFKTRIRWPNLDLMPFTELGLCRQEMKNVNVARADGAEVAAVERRQLVLAQPFDDGDDRGVYETEVQVGVPAEQLANPNVVVSQ